MSTVVLINPFVVPAGQEEEFLKRWREAAEHPRHAPGFVSTRLHESLDPQAKFRFVNVAEWESPQHFQAAMRTEAFQEIARRMPFAASPVLYRVVAEAGEFPPQPR
jgi:heme oxygenase (mycobilin-producing)